MNHLTEIGRITRIKPGFSRFPCAENSWPCASYSVKYSMITNPVSVIAYHGSSKLFKSFDQRYARILNDYMGGGIAYFTTDLDIAKTYAKSMAKTTGTGTEFIYTVELNMKNVFDVDNEFTGTDLVSLLPLDVEQFARGSGILKYGVDRVKTIMDLKSGKMSLSGERVFKGLSQGGVNTAKARDILIAHGFDALRYNGGANMNMTTRHDVYIPYDASVIDIQRISKIVRKIKQAA